MKRISTASKAHSFVKTLMNDDLTRAKKRNKVHGMINGNPPFDPKVLKKTGQAHRCNVNFMEGKGIIDARNTSFFQLFLDGRILIEARLRDAQRYMGRARFWESIVQEELRTLLTEDWPDFEYEMMRLADSMNTDGDGFPLWEAIDEWKWKTFITGEVLFPKNTKASVGYIKSAVIIGEFQISDLYAKWKLEKADDMGWSKAQIKKTIMRALKRTGGTEDDWQQLQVDLENDSLAADNGLTTPIRVAHILAKEDNGKISHYIVERGFTKDDFIFKKDEAYESLEECFIPFIVNIGNGYFHGVKGIGHRVFPSVVINNRLLNRTIDGAMDSQSMVISFADGTARKGKLLRLGNTIMLPPGGKLEQHHMERNLQSATGVYSLLTQVNQSSQGIKRPGMAALAKNESAKYSARADTREAIEEVELGATEIKLYYRQVDMLYAQMCKRIWKSHQEDAKRFRKRCVERGVPEKLLEDPKLWKFMAPRLIGSGSKVMRHMSTQEILSVAPYLPEHGKRAVIEDFIEARGGSEAVQRYYPPYEDDRMPTRSHQMAQIENTLLVQGQGMIVSIDDWHTTHLESHFPFVEQFVNNAMQSGNPEEIMKAMAGAQMFLDHIGNHMAYLKGDDLHARQFGEFNQRLKALIPKIRNIEKGYRQIVAEQQRQAELRQKQMEELQQKGDQTELMKHLMDVQADVQMRQYKEDQNHQVRLTKMLHSLQLAEAETQAYIDRENRKAEGTRS